MLARILDLSEDVRARNPLPSLRVVISSGARLDPSLARRFSEAYGDIIYNGYGSSEVGIGALATPTDLREAPETVGRPVVGCAVRVLGENGEPVGPDVTGRVFVGGDLTFEGYTGGENKDVVDDMMDTGDMGYLDRAGRLFIVGRGDDMIVSGGENVYPRAVENALAEHPDVADNAVIGVPDEDYGQRLVAFVVPQPDADVRRRVSPRVPERQSISLRATPGHQDRGGDSPQSGGQGRSERADALTRRPHADAAKQTRLRAPCPEAMSPNAASTPSIPIRRVTSASRSSRPREASSASIGMSRAGSLAP